MGTDFGFYSIENHHSKDSIYKNDTENSKEIREISEKNMRENFTKQGYLGDCLTTDMYFTTKRRIEMSLKYTKNLYNFNIYNCSDGLIIEETQHINKNKEISITESLSKYNFSTMTRDRKKEININEIKDKIKNIHKFKNQKLNDKMDLVISKTIIGFSNFVSIHKPDLIVLHGDRVESLACATVGCLNNIKTAHIEGGEVSCAVDEILRHSISKLSHIHFVTNLKAKKRLLQMGESKKSIFVIGSPDIDIIKSKNLPKIEFVKNWYGIVFEKYAIAILHPVTTDLKDLNKQCKIFLSAILESKKNYILIYTNNDQGSEVIIKKYMKLRKTKNIKLLPSIRFEYYLTLLKNASFIIGNSSSGIMEAPYYGLPTINIGNRQNKRANFDTIENCKFSLKPIKKLINKFSKKNIVKKTTKTEYFGKGQSFKIFNKILKMNNFWKIKSQKEFQDL